MYQTDCFYTIGDSHRECQDYAYTNRGWGQAAISDGCSSSKFTDIGARIAVHEWINYPEYLVECIQGKESPLYICERSRSFIKQVLEHNYLSILDCTLLGIDADTRKMFLCGDGAFAYTFKDNLYIHQRKYESNYPYYISYLIQEKEIEKKPEEVKTIYYIPNNSSYISYHPTEHIKVENIMPGAETVAVFSDGVESFSCNGKHIPATEVIKKLMDIKRFNGEFAQRQLNKFNRFCKQEGWTHYDDLSMAVVHFGE